MTEIWLFGEASWNTKQTGNQNFERLFKVSEACGYFIDYQKNGFDMIGTDCDAIKIRFVEVMGEKRLRIDIGRFNEAKSKLEDIWKNVLLVPCDKKGKVLEVAA